MKERITVVIPTYNRSTLLIKCIKALEAQTLPKSDFEVIVVSDGKDALTEGALQPWLKHSSLNLRFFSTPSRQGPAGARNLGWRNATHPIVAFTDDDCIPSANWLESLQPHFEYKEFLAVTGKTRVPLPENPSDFAINLAHLETADFITANCACTKAALEKVEGFDERYKMAWREDSDLEFKFLSNQIPIVLAKDAEVVHPVRTAPWGVSIKEQKKGLYDALLFKKFPSLYREKIQATPLWDNYLITILTLGLFITIGSGSSYAVLIFATLLAYKFVCLILLRLKRVNKSAVYVSEMITTSMIIPFLSVYWRIYGAVKYRVFFI
jgi:glycosyltransferase involved in cell wall biosynthesis